MVTELIRQCVDENACVGLDQSQYQQRYDGIVIRYEKVKGTLEKVEEQRQAAVQSVSSWITFLPPCYNKIQY